MFLARRKISGKLTLVDNLRKIPGLGHSRTKLLFQHLPKAVLGNY